MLKALNTFNTYKGMFRDINGTRCYDFKAK